MTMMTRWRLFTAGLLTLVLAACSSTPEMSNSRTPADTVSPAGTGTRTDTQAPTGTTETAVPTETAVSTETAVPMETAVPTETAVPADPQTAAATTIASGLDVPWGVDFFPDGDALVSERDTARLLRIDNGGTVAELATVQGVTPTAEGGLLGVAVSPEYESDGLLYVYSTTAEDNRVRRGTVDDFRRGQDTVILAGIPRGEIHNGGRIHFGPDGRLYVSTGEAGQPDLSQDPDSLGGKILRLEPDGSIPADNPFAGSPVWSYGHRNVQGMAWDSDGRMWASEFGASTWDEINRIMPGQNYGWPEAEGTSDRPDFTDPAAVFSTSSASPSGLAFADGYLWLGALQGATLWRVRVADDGVLTDPTAIQVEPARTRSVVLAPDGQLWLTTSNTDGRGQPARDEDKVLAINP